MTAPEPAENDTPGHAADPDDFPGHGLTAEDCAALLGKQIG